MPIDDFETAYYLFGDAIRICLPHDDIAEKEFVGNFSSSS